MHSLPYALGTLGTFLEVLLLWRIQRERLWHHYPFFSAFVGFVSCKSLVLVIVLQRYGYRSQLYSKFYWMSEIVAVALWALIAWEIFRHSFPRKFAARGVVAGGSAVLGGLMALLLLVAHREVRLPSTAGFVVTDLEHYVSFIGAPVILWFLVAARYYHAPVRRNIWGMAVGFGTFLSFVTAHFAAYALGYPPRDPWWIFSAVGFVAMLGIWTWALWRHAPNPKFAPAPAERAELDFILWRQEWDRLLASMRKAFE